MTRMNVLNRTRTPPEDEEKNIILIQEIHVFLHLCMFYIYWNKIIKLYKSFMSEVQPVEARDIQKFVRSRVDHNYNKDVFQSELNQEIQKNLGRMEESIIKDLKRKMIIKNQEQEDLEKRSKIKKQLEEKLSKSKEKREKDKSKKAKQLSLQKKYKKQLFNQRINQIKKTEKQKTLEKLKQFEQQDKIAGPKYNKVDRAVSLIEEPHYRKKLQIQQDEYNRLKKIVDSKQAFKDTRTKKRQLSLSELKPRQTTFESLEKERVNQMGEHLQKIDETRKKRENMMKQKIKNSQFQQTMMSEQRNQRLKLIIQAQKKREQTIVAKLSKSGIQSSKSLKMSSAKIDQVQPEAKNQIKGSIIYEQSQQRQKHSYRKEIKQQIKQYMLKQKQKLLNSSNK